MKYKCYPVDYINITGGYNSSHQAIDFGWWGDTSNRPIYSVSDGKVLEVRNNYNTKDESGNSYGNYVLVENSDGSRSTYCHLKYGSISVNVGDNISFHQHLGTMGETGRANAPHLHYEHRINNVKVNPFDYLYCYDDFQEINYSKENCKYIKIKPEEKEDSDIIITRDNLINLIKRTINGDFGNGEDRKNNLGDLYSIVQEQVNLNYDHGTINNPKLYN